jgi:hypothetical protein
MKLTNIKIERQIIVKPVDIKKDKIYFLPNIQKFSTNTKKTFQYNSKINQ